MKTLEDQTILLDTRDNSIHVLNKTGAVIWSLCDGTHTLASIIDEVGKRFSAPEDADLERDVVGLIESLREKNLLR
jgi:coenzyme PQQ biosynthesis protein PqqD